MNITKPIAVDKNLVAYCGLYCGACSAYLKDRAPDVKKMLKPHGAR